MTPDPKEWAAEALILFRGTGRPSKEWPQFRDEFIVTMARREADRHQRKVLSTV